MGLAGITVGGHGVQSRDGKAPSTRQRRRRRGIETAASRRRGRGEGTGVRGRLPPIFSWGSRQAGLQGEGLRGPRGPFLRDWFRLVAAAMMTMTGDDDDMVVGTEGKDKNQLKWQWKKSRQWGWWAMMTAMVTGTNIN